MTHRGLALKMLAIYRETMELRSSPLRPSRPDFSVDRNKRPTGKHADSWWREEYEKTGHEAPLLPDYSPYLRETRFRAGEIPEDLLIIAQVELVKARVSSPELLVAALAESLVGWDDWDLVAQRVALIEAESVVERIRANREKERARLRGYRARRKGRLGGGGS